MSSADGRYPPAGPCPVELGARCGRLLRGWLRRDAGPPRAGRREHARVAAWQKEDAADSAINTDPYIASATVAYYRLQDDLSDAAPGNAPAAMYALAEWRPLGCERTHVGPSPPFIRVSIRRRAQPLTGRQVGAARRGAGAGQARPSRRPDAARGGADPASIEDGSLTKAVRARQPTRRAGADGPDRPRCAAVFDLLGQQRLQQRVELGGCVGPQAGEPGKVLGHVGEDHCDGRVGLERSPSGEQVEERGSKAVEVGCRCHLPSCRLLGRHEGRRPHEHSLLGDIRVAGRAVQARQPEIQDLDDPGTREHQVGRLDVAMDDLLAMDVAQTRRRLLMIAAAGPAAAASFWRTR